MLDQKFSGRTMSEIVSDGIVSSKVASRKVNSDATQMQCRQAARDCPVLLVEYFVYITVSITSDTYILLYMQIKPSTIGTVRGNDRSVGRQMETRAERRRPTGWIDASSTSACRRQGPSCLMFMSIAQSDQRVVF